jgi:hypothetical protein
MAKNKQKTYWPHMILGFLFLAIALSYWTIRAASSMPVQTTNDYMMNYQLADMTINEIMESKQAFDAAYQITLQDYDTMVMTDNIHSNRPQLNPVVLHKGPNHFVYQLSTRAGEIVTDANVSFLLTRPHTRVDDQMLDQVSAQNGKFITPDVLIEKPGRYTLVLRAKIGEMIGFSEMPAYLKP